MRKHKRHQMEVPVEICLKDVALNKTEYLKNVSTGGLCFKSRVEVKINTVVDIRMPLTRPVFRAAGRVAWCRQGDDCYEVGVEFIQAQDHFKVRMIEQICHIENYKREVRENEGRTLTGEQAALEWIARYAGTFGRDDEEDGGTAKK